MAEALLRGKVLKWGNSFGIRVKKEDLERLGLKPGQEVDLTLASTPRKIDLSHMPVFRSGRSDISERHDEYIGQALWEEHLESTGQLQRLKEEKRRARR